MARGSSVVCTLFEKDYHIGFGALLNSLIRRGFKGEIHAGYRDCNAVWLSRLMQTSSKNETALSRDVKLTFRYLDAPRHYMLFKPDFMLDVLKNSSITPERIFYFDPDIVVKASWQFFEQWADYGVALCEDVNSPVYPTHPRRKAWQQFLTRHNYDTTVINSTGVYINSGFVGLNRRFCEFLAEWKKIEDTILEDMGDKLSEIEADSNSPFNKTDQDALNMAVERTKEPCSIVGQEGMDFKPGGTLMSHGIGSPKSWKKHLLLRALLGMGPSAADKEFYKNLNGPVLPFSRTQLRLRRAQLVLAKAIIRFVRRPAY
jgi:lipopolysaccharide biosynthesis glycosyltransferase